MKFIYENELHKLLPIWFLAAFAGNNLYSLFCCNNLAATFHEYARKHGIFLPVLAFYIYRCIGSSICNLRVGWVLFVRNFLATKRRLEKIFLLHNFSVFRINDWLWKHELRIRIKIQDFWRYAYFSGFCNAVLACFGQRFCRCNFPEIGYSSQKVEFPHSFPEALQ